MEMAVMILAVLGVAAVLRELMRSLLRLLRREVDRVWAGELARSRGGRGDLTGMQEADVELSRARRARRREIARLGVWVVVLVAPALTSWAVETYALLSLLWLVPRRGSVAS